MSGKLNGPGLCHGGERCFIDVRDSRLPASEEIPGKRGLLNWALATAATETRYSIAPSQQVPIVRDGDTGRVILIAKWSLNTVIAAWFVCLVD